MPFNTILMFRNWYYKRLVFKLKNSLNALLSGTSHKASSGEKKSHCSWKKNETLEQTFIFKIRVVEDLLIKTLQKHRDLKDDSGEECYTFKILTTKRKETDVFERSFEYFYKEWVFCFIIRKRRNSLRSIAIVTMGGVADLCCCQRLLLTKMMEEFLIFEPPSFLIDSSFFLSKSLQSSKSEKIY